MANMFMTKITQQFAVKCLRPYISREFPAWGKLYAAFVGDFQFDEQWKGYEPVWVRGKYHGYEMLLDLGQWSNRQTFFLKRFYDLPTQLLIRHLIRPGDAFVDVGANEGMISLLASRLVGATGRVIAFEPNPGPRTRLKLAIERNSIANIDVIPSALGDVEGTLPLTIPLINTGEGSFGQSRYPVSETTVLECKILRGDEILTNVAPVLVKVDVEGFEFRVLSGLQQTIARSRPAIIMETYFDLLHRAGSSVSAISEFLQRLDYSPLRLSMRGRTSLRLVPGVPPDNAHGDYLWIQTDDLPKVRQFIS